MSFFFFLRFFFNYKGVLTVLMFQRYFSSGGSWECKVIMSCVQGHIGKPSFPVRYCSHWIIIDNQIKNFNFLVWKVKLSSDFVLDYLVSSFCFPLPCFSLPFHISLHSACSVFLPWSPFQSFLIFCFKKKFSCCKNNHNFIILGTKQEM